MEIGNTKKNMKEFFSEKKIYIKINQEIIYNSSTKNDIQKKKNRHNTL